MSPGDPQQAAPGVAVPQKDELGTRIDLGATFLHKFTLGRHDLGIVADPARHVARDGRGGAPGPPARGLRATIRRRRQLRRAGLRQLDDDLRRLHCLGGACITREERGVGIPGIDLHHTVLLAGCQQAIAGVRVLEIRDGALVAFEREEQPGSGRCW